MSTYKHGVYAREASTSMVPVTDTAGLLLIGTVDEVLRFIFSGAHCDESRCNSDIDCETCARNWLNSEAK